MINVNYYKILELKDFSGFEEIKNQYKKLIKQYHPDKGGSDIKFIEVKNAYDYLLSHKEIIDENLFIHEQILEKCEELNENEYTLQINDVNISNIRDLLMKYEDNEAIEFSDKNKDSLNKKLLCNNLEEKVLGLTIHFECHQCSHKNNVKIECKNINVNISNCTIHKDENDIRKERINYSILNSLLNSTIIVECNGCSLKFKINL